MREFNNPADRPSPILTIASLNPSRIEVTHFIRVFVQRILPQPRIIGIAAILTAYRQTQATHRLA